MDQRQNNLNIKISHNSTTQKENDKILSMFNNLYYYNSTMLSVGLEQEKESKLYIPCHQLTVLRFFLWLFLVYTVFFSMCLYI